MYVVSNLTTDHGMEITSVNDIIPSLTYRLRHCPSIFVPCLSIFEMKSLSFDYLDGSANVRSGFTETNVQS